MSRRLALLVLFFCALCVSAQTRFDEIRDVGVLYGGIVGQDNYPFVYQINGQWAGYEIDLLNQTAESLGVALVIREFASPEELLAAVADSHVDLGFSKILRNPANSERSFQTSPVARVGLMIVVNRVAYAELQTSGDLIKDLSEGRVPVAVPADPIFERELIREYPGLAVERLPPDLDSWCCIERGEHIAVALDSASVYYYFARFPERGISLRVVPVESGAAIVGLVPWRDDRFWEWVNILIEGQGDPASLESLTSRYLTGFESRSDE